MVGLALACVVPGGRGARSTNATKRARTAGIETNRYRTTRFARPRRGRPSRRSVRGLVFKTSRAKS